MSPCRSRRGGGVCSLECAVISGRRTYYIIPFGDFKSFSGFFWESPTPLYIYLYILYKNEIKLTKMIK